MNRIFFIIILIFCTSCNKINENDNLLFKEKDIEIKENFIKYDITPNELTFIAQEYIYKKFFYEYQFILKYKNIYKYDNCNKLILETYSKCDSDLYNNIKIEFCLVYDENTNKYNCISYNLK